MKITTFEIAVILVLTASAAFAGPPAGTWALGARVGLFTNTQNQDEIRYQQGDNEVQLFPNKTNFYLEGFVNYYFTSYFAAVANVGSYTKGDIRYDAFVVGLGPASFLGSASIYPIQLGARLSPFTQQLPLKMMPYVEAGGALIVGRETVAGLEYDAYLGRFTDGTLTTESDWSWWVGGGTEIPLSPTIQIDIMGKYIDNQFTGDIAGIRDFTGFQASIGVSYHALK